MEHDSIRPVEGLESDTRCFADASRTRHAVGKGGEGVKIDLRGGVEVEPAAHGSAARVDAIETTAPGTAATMALSSQTRPMARCVSGISNDEDRPARGRNLGIFPSPDASAIIVVSGDQASTPCLVAPGRGIVRAESVECRTKRRSVATYARRVPSGRAGPSPSTHRSPVLRSPVFAAEDSRCPSDRRRSPPVRRGPRRPPPRLRPLPPPIVSVALAAAPRARSRPHRARVARHRCPAADLHSF